MNTALTNPKNQMLIIWSKWFLATSIAWLLIVIIFSRYMNFYNIPTEYKYTGFGVKLQAFIMIGAVIGVLQWLALIRHIRYAWLWVLATIGGVVLGVLISGAFKSPNNLLIDLAIIFMPVSIFQTLILNVTVPGAWRWMPIKAVGFLTSYLFTVLGGWVFLFFGPIFGACIGMPFAAVTGLELVWMIGKTRPISESIPQPFTAKPTLVKTRAILIGLSLIISVPLISWLAIRWNANEQALVAPVTTEPVIAKGGRILSKEFALNLAFSPDSNILAYSNRENLILYDIKQNKREQLKSSGYGALAFSPDGSLLAANEDGKVILWDMETKQPVGIPMVADSEYLDSIVFSPDGKLLVTAKDQVLIWDVVTYQFYDPSLKGNLAAFSPDGKTLIIGSFVSNSIIFWDVITHQQIGSPIIVYSVLSIGLNELIINPNGQILATGTSVQLWDMASHKLLDQQLEGGNFSSQCLAFSPDGKVLASSRQYFRIVGSIVLWDMLTFKPIGSPLTGHSEVVFKLAFSPDGKYLASSTRDDGIFLWDMSVILH